MATCYPDYKKTPRPFGSSAEEQVYWSLYEALPDQFHVFHSVGWISKPTGRSARDGETDFLICHPQLGLLTLEVKGGGISLDYASGQWTSTDRVGRRHEIANPFEQAQRGKYSALEKLREHPDWKRFGFGKITIGHAVVFPSIGDGQRLRGPDAPGEIIGDNKSFADPRSWIESLFAYWSLIEPVRGSGRLTLGSAGVELVKKVFARVVSTDTLLSARILDEEKKRIELTDRQMGVLDFLQRQRRVTVSGGAGTGKTLIAREKATRLAGEGFKTLLTCYNRSLADHLREVTSQIAGLEVASFHQLCHLWIAKTRAETQRDLIREAQDTYPGHDLYDHYYPIALSFAIDIAGPQYDAIVVDEGQDFGEEFWMPIELLLKDNKLSPLYIFLDENQDIYTRANAFPLSGEPIVLDRNCRNTAAIHEIAYKYYRGSPVEKPPIPGSEIGKIVGNTEDKQGLEIGRVVSRLIAEQGIRPEDIAVLIGDRPRRQELERIAKNVRLPSGARWGRLENYGPGCVTVDTVARFKGLERPVIILWGINTLSSLDRKGTLYVGMSRAKSLLYVCGTIAECATLLGSD